MKTVVVGISGGVDSSVAAILLKNQGYNVIGLFMRNWDSTINNDFLGNPDLNGDICPQEKDYNDALAVCQKIGIPLHRVDYVKEYWDNVFTYFLDELNKGRTPNPDVMCNKYIKFDLFYKKAKELGADYIATGHYAKIINGQLYKANDKNKDQSYFLAYVNKDVFKDVLFPLQDIDKPEVRKIANEYNLVTATKKDSTGICFIGERNFKKFLENYIPNQPGKIIDITNNQVVGQHFGVMYYTIGQRKGLNLGGLKERYFVCSKDINNKILFVAPNSLEKEYLESNCLIIKKFNWQYKPKTFKNVLARFRHGQEFQNVYLEFKNNLILVNYQSQKNIAIGQYCVLYQDNYCLGGGVIEEVFKK